MPSATTRDEEGNRLFAEEGSAEGCASGECLPDEPTSAADEEPEAPPPAAAPARPALPTGPGIPTADRWRHAVDTVRVSSPRHGASLANGRLLWFRRGEEAIDIGVGFTQSAAFHRTTVSAASGKAQIEKALSEHFQRPVRLSIEQAQDVVEAAAPSLAELDARDRAAHAKTTDAKVRLHPSVMAALKQLGGEVEHVQIYEKPRVVRSLEDEPGEEP